MTLVPIRPRPRGGRRSLRTFSPGARFSPPITPRFQSRRASTPFDFKSDAFRLRPDVAWRGTTLSFPRCASRCGRTPRARRCRRTSRERSRRCCNRRRRRTSRRRRDERAEDARRANDKPFRRLQYIYEDDDFYSSRARVLPLRRPSRAARPRPSFLHPFAVTAGSSTRTGCPGCTSVSAGRTRSVTISPRLCSRD